jgi:release factor glutamine methyltransferase
VAAPAGVYTPAMSDESEAVLAALEAGKSDFMGHEFLVARGVIVPRPVTEVMIRASQSLLNQEEPYTFLDVGCGTGLIGIVLAKRFPKSRVICLDITDDCVRLTQKNVEKHGLTDRVSVRHSDMFAAVQDVVGQVDAVVSSPPFISTSRLAKDRAHLLDLEPREAFDAGPFGIAIHQRLVKESKAMLRPSTGWLITEVGNGQHEQMNRLLTRSGGYDQISTFREHTDQYIACVAARLT